MKRKRAPKRLEDMRQRVLIETPPTESPTPRAPEAASFRVGDRAKLYVGNKPLKTYLIESGQARIVRLAERIDRIDVTELMRAYSPLGRHAIHPRIILGLILLGILSGRSSLRDLEQLAMCDVRAWWLCGGEQPDHSTIGKFIVAHKEWIAGAGFQSALEQAIRGLGINPGDASMDGTVIQSAASHLDMLKREAARAVADDAARTAKDQHDNPDAQRHADDAQKVADAISARVASREMCGKPADGLKIAPSDPDAVNQPRKDGVVRPSYKPSILVTADQFVVGHYVDGSSETAAVASLIEQHERIFGAAPTTLLGDAGYWALSVFAIAMSKQIDLLCPSGRANAESAYERAPTERFGKHLFVFQPDTDTYRCPAGDTLRRGRSDQDRYGRTRTNYGGANCRQCSLRAQCTTSVAGRTIKRYDDDALKESMREVMKQPAARAKYKRRSTMVEPVFARLQQMGLRRMRRRGLDRVRAEFALYCMAYNFRRADGIYEARIAAFALVRVPWGSTMRVVAVGLVATTVVY